MKGLSCIAVLMMMASVVSATQRWTGGAGTTDWTNGANWDGGAAPDGVENVYVSASGINGTAVLSTVSSGGTFGVGWYADGTSTLTIAPGGSFSNTGTSYLGYDATAHGTINVDGGHFTSGDATTDDLIVGYEGTGVLNISNGGTVTAGDFYFGYLAGGSGSLTVTGSGSELNSLGATFVLGRSGDTFGSLEIHAGGAVRSTGTAYMSNVYSSRSRAVVEGAGSVWKHAGTLLVGDEGGATLYITNGGLVVVDDLRINGDDSAGVKADCFIRMTSGGMLALKADGIVGDTLADFLDAIRGSDDIEYLADSQWEYISRGIEGLNYSLDTYTEDGIAYRRLTVHTSSPFRLAAPFSSNMVLQQQSHVAVRGWAAPGSTITVTPDWTTAVSAVADADGAWSAIVSTPAGSETAHSLTVSDDQGHSTTLTNILIGEVWFCSGQSNMWWPLQDTDNGAAAIASPNTNIRLFTVSKKLADQPQRSCGGLWQVSSTNTLPDFSAIAYYFGRELQRELGVPIGLIDNAWGGTRAEPWTPREAMARDSRLFQLLEEVVPGDKYEPTVLFNGMVNPLVAFPVKGVIWYQGESNRGRYEEYRTLFPTMIKAWRSAWKQQYLPFYFVQLAPLILVDEPVMKIPLLQEAQLYTMQTVTNTGMAVTTDIGNINDVHPRNKLDVGNRLSYWALTNTYGRSVLFSGPIYREMVVEGSNARILFDYDEGGLVSNGILDDFVIAGSNMVFYPASAVIESNSVVVSSGSVSAPAAVRYCWKNEAEGNLYNVDAGLPASPFRTDTEELYDTSSAAPASVFGVGP